MPATTGDPKAIAAIRAVVADDEPIAREYLKLVLSRVGGVEVVAEAGEALSNRLRGSSYVRTGGTRPPVNLAKLGVAHRVVWLSELRGADVEEADAPQRRQGGSR